MYDPLTIRSLPLILYYPLNHLFFLLLFIPCLDTLHAPCTIRRRLLPHRRCYSRLIERVLQHRPAHEVRVTHILRLVVVVAIKEVYK
jgi:hypothetical protein